MIKSRTTCDLNGRSIGTRVLPVEA